MAKDKITEYDATANNNTVCGDVNIAENSALPSDMNNFAREIMSHLKEGLGSGTPLYVDQTNNRVGINKTPTVALDVSGSLSVDGGTIKLDGNYPVGTDNVALGNASLDSLTTGSNNTSIGNSALTGNTEGASNVAIGRNALRTNTTSDFNIAIGDDTLRNNTASANTAVGYHAGYSNSTGSPIVAMGYYTLDQNTTGVHNNAYGYRAMRFNTTGGYNTAVGGDVLYSNTTASSNNAFGYQALYSNTTGDENNSFGRASLYANTTGQDNVAMGHTALRFNTTGSYNTGLGYSALYSNTTASSNTAVGYRAGYSNTTGGANTFIGRESAYNHSTSGSNTIVGFQAGYTGTAHQYNTFVGTQAGYFSTGTGNCFVGATRSSIGSGGNMTTGSKNVILGSFAGNEGGLDIRTSSNNIVLSDGDGNLRQWITSDGSVYIGNTSQPNGTSSYGAAFVATTSDRKNLHMATSSTNDLFHIRFYNPNGAVGSIRTSGSSTSYITSSDYRLKENVVDLTGSANRVQQLNPVRFNFIADADKTVDGFLAHEVADIVPEAITGTKDAVDADGNPEYQGIDQSKLVPLLTAALQEALTKINALEARVAALESN